MYLELVFSPTFSYGDVQPNGAKVRRAPCKSPVGFVLNAPLDRNGPEGFVMKDWDVCENTRLLTSFSLFCYGCRLGCENWSKIVPLAPDAHYLQQASAVSSFLRFGKRVFARITFRPWVFAILLFSPWVLV